MQYSTLSTIVIKLLENDFSNDFYDSTIALMKYLSINIILIASFLIRFSFV